MYHAVPINGDHKPAVVVAFPGGRGTADMLRRAEHARRQGTKLQIVEIRPIAAHADERHQP